MFVLVVAGRHPQPSQRLDETSFKFEVHNAAMVSHLCIFLDPSASFPPEYGAACFFRLNGTSDWQQLGFLTNNKPSSIFKLSGSSHIGALTDGFSLQASSTAEIGIQIQPQLVIENAALQQTEKKMLQATGKIDGTVHMANLLAKHLFNYLAGFAQTSTGIRGNFVDITLLQKWLKTTEEKTKASGSTTWLENQD